MHVRPRLAPRRHSAAARGFPARLPPITERLGRLEPDTQPERDLLLFQTACRTGRRISACRPLPAPSRKGKPAAVLHTFSYRWRRENVDGNSPGGAASHGPRADSRSATSPPAAILRGIEAETARPGGHGRLLRGGSRKGGIQVDLEENERAAVVPAPQAGDVYPGAAHEFAQIARGCRYV